MRFELDFTNLYVTPAISKKESSAQKELQKTVDQYYTIQEKQAEIFPSVDDQHVSLCMRKMRKEISYYPGYLYSGHYNTLVTINELHKMIDWIKEATIQ